VEEAGALRLSVSVAEAVDPLLRVKEALPVSVAEEVITALCVIVAVEETRALRLEVSVADVVGPLLRLTEALPVSVAEEVTL